MCMRFKNPINIINYTMMTTKPLICLNMIVKDEAHCITETLRCMAKYINYYVIADTGSTDNTKEVIKNFFDANQIPGEIHDCVWKNFGYNRTEALKLCKGKSQYIWVMDADDLVVGNFEFPDLTLDAYNLTFGLGFTYERTQIFKNSMDYDWMYVGVVHEYPKASVEGLKYGHIVGDYYIDSRRLGARNKVGDKYLRDAALLEADLKINPDNERSVFYLAQSYFDSGDTERGIEWYRKRIAMGRWQEEVYYSYLRIARGYVMLGKPWEECEQAYLDCYKSMEIRAEALFELMEHYNSEQNWKMAYKYGKMAMAIPYPESMKLFVDKEVYDYKTAFELSLTSYYVGQIEESMQLMKKILATKGVPDHLIKRTEDNLKFPKEALKNIKKKTLCICFPDKMYDITQLIDNLLEYYDVYYVANICVTTKAVWLPDYSQSITLDYVICMDNMAYLYEKEQDKQCMMTRNIILYVTSPVFQIQTKNGYNVEVYDKVLLESMMKNVNTIVCQNNNIGETIVTSYGVNPGCIQIHNIFTNLHHCNILGVKTKPFTMNKKSDAYVICDHMYIDVLFKQQILFYKNTYKYLKNDYVKLYQTKYLNKVNKYDDALETVAEVLKTTRNSDYLMNMAIYEKAVALHHIKDYKGNDKKKNQNYFESFTLLNYLLDNFKLDGKIKEEAELLRDRNVEYVKDDYLVYPKMKIKNIINNLKTNKEKNAGIRVMLTITTCKRYDLFEKTINSFINASRDIQHIDHYLCIDDNSSDEDREKMQSLYPFFEFVFKTPEQKGHYVSMNMIYDAVCKYNPEYILHMEDDWHFIDQRAYVEDAMDILKSDPKLGQVLFNKNYAEVERHIQNIKGGIPQRTPNGRRYILHEYYDPASQEYRNFVDKHGGGACAYWPHYSFRPSIVRCSVLKQLGKFINTPHFEMQYAKEYFRMGFRSAFFDTFGCIHIGKKTWEKTENAYAMNNVNQFGSDASELSVRVIKTTPESWVKFKETVENKLDRFIMKEIVLKQTLNNFEKSMFVGNEFSYRRDMIGNIMAHYDLYNESDSEYLMVVYDNVVFPDNFMELVNGYLKTCGNFDVIMLDYGDVAPNLLDEYDLHKELLSCPNYIISKKGINKMMERKCLDYVYGVLLLERQKIIYEPLKVIDGYIFYSWLDSYGNDIVSHVGKSIAELKEIADGLDNCVCFNSLGYLKNKVCDETDMVYLINSRELEHGLYVKVK